ncbi:DUF6904 family protein [Sporolactobacillus spathodeae]|uniref:Virion structural protein n=1 Tax=Sporolactobacillus spathodeae TaxID=1465502 RepID=A0ABS2Q8Q3_9BACL|nr:hypothetical protein [Sporolactobacillus spathodeae]MBM7658123.1 hypothetical protein [Sporolactobacillus spathodeae]
MLHAMTTPKAAGVTLSGDLDDFNELYDALAELIGDENEYELYGAARIRVLGFMYDLRHAFQGDREVVATANGMNHEIMKYQGVVTPEKNVTFAFNTVWVEMIFVVAVLNDFILLHTRKIEKANPIGEKMLRPKIIYNPAIAYVRHFQAIVMRALKDTVSENAYVRLVNAMVHDYTYYGGYATQFVDQLAIKYIGMDNEKRLNNLTRFANQIVNRSGDYRKMMTDLLETAAQYHCSIEDLRLEGSAYPEEIDW